MLEKLFKQNSKKEVHIYMSNIEKVLSEAKARIKARETEALANNDFEQAHAYTMALTELAFINSEIMLEQLKTESNA